SPLGLSLIPVAPNPSRDGYSGGERKGGCCAREAGARPQLRHLA
ncbi:unnamed protein product, partial [Urochloa humidicola]